MVDRTCRTLIGRTVHFVGNGMPGPDRCIAAIVTSIKGDGDRPNANLVTLGDHDYPNVERHADVPYSYEMASRSWHFVTKL